MREPDMPGNRRTPLRRAAALAVGFAALVAWSLVPGPVAAVASGGPCALRRAEVRHSEGVGSWNPAYPRPLGDVHAVLIFLSFPDHVPALTPRQLTADHFPATSDFFARASYGRFRLHPHPVGRWLRMPAPSTAYGIHRDWLPELRARYVHDALATAARAVDFRRYRVVYVIADPDAPGVDADATKVLNLDDPVRVRGAVIRHLVTVFEHHPPDRDVLAHETNHIFDLPDLYYRPPQDSPTAAWDTRVGDWDVMGSQFGLAPELFAWHKWKYGWLGPGQVRCVDHPGTSRTLLRPVETPGGTKLVVVRTGASTALAMEARAARGNDVTTCSEGVLLYEVRTDVESGEGPIRVLDGHPRTGACAGLSVYPPLADAPLTGGQSYTYRFGAAGHTAVRVTVAGRPGAWTVTTAER